MSSDPIQPPWRNKQATLPAGFKKHIITNYYAMQRINDAFTAS